MLAFGPKAREAWQHRHDAAVYTPHDNERLVLDALRVLYGITSAHSTDGYVVPNVFGPAAQACLDLLNVDMGRLDGGKCDSFVRELAGVVGWNLDRQEWA